MDYVKKHFEEIQRKNTYLSDIICYGRVVRERKMNRYDIARNFFLLVDKGEYAKSDEESLVAHFHKLSGECQNT